MMCCCTCCRTMLLSALIISTMSSSCSGVKSCLLSSALSISSAKPFIYYIKFIYKYILYIYFSRTGFCVQYSVFSVVLVC